MTDPIDDADVALSLMREALRLLDAPEHGVAAARLRSAIDALSSEQSESAIRPHRAEVTANRET